MTLSAVSDGSGIPSNWDWKSMYVDRLANGDTLDMFSEASVTSETMLLMAGPPRLAGEKIEDVFSPLGLVNDVSMNIDNSLRPIWEIGTNVTYFTRGKAAHSMQIGAMVANKASLMKVLTRQSPTATPDFPKDVQGEFWMNLDTETIAKPFGILVIFKTKAGEVSGQNGTFVGGVYLENCNIGSFALSMNSQAAFLQENVTIMFDRAISVDYAVGSV